MKFQISKILSKRFNKTLHVGGHKNPNIGGGGSRANLTGALGAAPQYWPHTSEPVPPIFWRFHILFIFYL